MNDCNLLYASRSNDRVLCPLNLAWHTRWTGTKNTPMLKIDGLVERTTILKNGNTRNFLMRENTYIPWTPRVYVACCDSYVESLRKNLEFVIMVEKLSSFKETTHNKGNMQTERNVPFNEPTSKCSVATTCSTNAQATAQIFDNAVTFITVIGHCYVNTLYRNTNMLLWTRTTNRRLYEIQFKDWSTYNCALDYLLTNATTHSNDYAMFANSRDVTFNVALTSALSKSRLNLSKLNLESEFRYAH